MKYSKLINNIINNEIEILQELKNILDPNIEILIDKIITSNKRIIFSGIGKSGHIAKKIVSSFISLNIDALFLHPSEASHGDLGIVKKDDIVIIISNSGESKECYDLVKFCNNNRIYLTLISKNKNSYIGEKANNIILIPNCNEINNFNAPMNSITATLVIGHIIAYIVTKIRKFTKDDFIKNHPGGKIGSDFIFVNKIMRKGSKIPIKYEDSNFKDVIIEITKKSVGCCIIINRKNNDICGIITDGDIRRNINKDIDKILAKDIMKKNPKIIIENKLLKDAVHFMNDNKITNLIVKDKDSQLSGLLHIHDLINYSIED